MRASGSCYKKSMRKGQEGCNQFCSKEELWREARDEGMTIPWQEANVGPPVKIMAAKTGWNWIGHGN